MHRPPPSRALVLLAVLSALVVLDAPAAGAATASSTAPPPQRETRTVVTSDCTAVATGGTGTTTTATQVRRRPWVQDATGQWVPAPSWSPWRTTTTTRPATTTQCPPLAPPPVAVAVSWYVQDGACLAGTATPTTLYGVSHAGLHWWVNGVDVLDGLGTVDVVLPRGTDRIVVTADPGIVLVGPASATYEVGDPCA